jgi:hypothetical protein
VLIEIRAIKNLGYFISNNDSINDVAIRYIFISLRKDIKNLNSRRIRYLDYIINFAAKAFLFRKEANTFKIETNIVR